MKIEFQFVKQDCWIGVFWKRIESGTNLFQRKQYRIYICLVPCFPIVITTKLKRFI